MEQPDDSTGQFEILKENVTTLIFVTLFQFKIMIFQDHNVLHLMISQ
jgi:hypothetical protein